MRIHEERLSPLAGLVILAVTALCLGCEPAGPDLPSEELPADPDLPEAVVDLPSPPPNSAFEIREHNDDGSLRVEGVIGKRDQYLETEIEVRGVVAETETHPRSHLYIRDHLDDSLDLLIVGFDDAFLRRAGVREGQEYLFRGTYLKMAEGFVSTEDGLLELTAIDDHNN